MKMRISNKINFLVASIIILLTIFIGFIFIRHETKAIKTELDERANTIVNNLAYNSKYGILVENREVLHRLLEGIRREKDVAYVKIENKEGKIIVHAGEIAGEAIKEYNASVVAESMPKAKEKWGFIQEMNSNEIKKETIGLVRVGVSLARMNRKTGELKNYIAGVSFVIITIACSIAFLGIRFFISRPLKLLLEGIKKISQGSLSHRIEKITRDEIGELVISFNKMTEDLSKTFVSKDYVDNIIMSMDDSLIVIDPDKKIKTINKATCLLLEYTEEELIDKPINMIFDNENNLFKKNGLSELIEKGSISNYELNYKTKTGDIIPVLFSASLMVDKKGELLAIVGVGKNITERKQLERKVKERTEQLEKTNRKLLREMTEKEDFLRAVSHDLGAPLRNIAGMASSLIKRYNKTLDEGAQYRLERIQSNADKEMELIQELLELSRIKTKREIFEYINLQNLVQGIKEEFEFQLETKAIELNIDNSLPMIYCEKNRIKQIFMNLIDNAIKYIGDTEKPRIDIGYNVEDNKITFWIKDNGMGIKKEDHQRIFHVFRRGKGREFAKVEGKGIGLASVKSIIENYNGELWVESEEGIGSTFYFTIPKEIILPETEVTRNGKQRNENTISG